VAADAEAIAGAHSLRGVREVGGGGCVQARCDELLWYITRYSNHAYTNRHAAGPAMPPKCASSGAAVLQMFTQSASHISSCTAGVAWPPMLRP
jgi:hypothetical protein